MKTAEAVLGNLAGLLWGNWMLFVLLGLGVFYKRKQRVPGTIREPYPLSRRFIWR